jgi:hypothetical protein
LNGNGTFSVRGGSISLGSAANAANTLTLNSAGTVRAGSITASTLIFSGTNGVLSGSSTILDSWGTLALNANVEMNSSVTLAAPVRQATGKVLTLNGERLDLDKYDWNMTDAARSGFQGGSFNVTSAGSLISGGDVVIPSGDISKLTIVMTGGGTASHSLINIHSGPDGIFRNFVMTGTYGPQDTTAYVEAASDLTLSGSWLIPSWTGWTGGTRSSPLSAIADRQRDEQRFFPVIHTVTLDGNAMVISGNTFWNKLKSERPDAVILFSNYPDVHTVLSGGEMRFEGQDSHRITIGTLSALQSGSIPAGTAEPGWLDVVSTAKDFFWILSKEPGATVYARFLNVLNNFAYYPVPINTSLVAAEWETQRTVNWIPGARFTYHFTEDSDGNGKLDRIRLQAPRELSWSDSKSPDEFRIDFSKNPGYKYEINKNAGTRGFDIYNNTLYVHLVEQNEPDTGERPEWTFVNEDVLMTIYEGSDSTVGSYAAVSPPNTSIVDTAPPRVYYTLALTGRDEIYIRFSEPVEDRKMRDLIGTDFDTEGKYVIADIEALEEKPLPVGAYAGDGKYAPKYLIKLDKALEADDLINGIVCKGELFREVRDAPPVPYDWPSGNTPAVYYPWDYYVLAGSLTGELGGGDFPDQLVNATSGNVSQPNFFMMGTMGTRADSDAATHRASDLLIMARPESADDTNLSLWPLYARDTAGLQDVKQGIARIYDGSEKIRNTDITVEGIVNKKLEEELSSKPEMQFMVNKDIEGLWLPYQDDGGARPSYLGIKHDQEVKPGDLKTSVSQKNGRNYFFSIRRDDILEAGMLDFLFSVPSPKYSPELGPLYGVRYKDSAPRDEQNLYNPDNFVNFKVNTGETKYQRSGATILSNVINPAKGEKAVLHYILTRGGQVTIQVFTLDGNLVQSLYRGSREAGEYDAVWDGKNRGGNIVARGMYFVRIVAPDIDEIRKVMVVK